MDIIKTQFKIIPGVALKCGYFEFTYDNTLYYHASKHHGKNGFSIYKALRYCSKNPYIMVVRDSKTMITHYDMHQTPVKLEITDKPALLRGEVNVLFEFQL
jgi:hypothetical protein